MEIDRFTFDRANSIQRALRRVAATGPGSSLFAGVMHRIDRPVYRLTRGRHTFASLVSGLPVVMLTTTGARSGRPRTVPVLGLPTAEGLAVIASNFGQHRHPSWYYNLRADPEGSVAVDGRSRRFRRVARSFAIRRAYGLNAWTLPDSVSSPSRDHLVMAGFRDPNAERDEALRARFAIRRGLSAMAAEEREMERAMKAFEEDADQAKRYIEAEWRREHWGHEPERRPTWGSGSAKARLGSSPPRGEAVSSRRR
jgi:deazaflavin-dependent oxidoreductase (nitroreductase family)